MHADRSDTPVPYVPACYRIAGDPRWYELEEGRHAGKQLCYTDLEVGEGGDLQTLLFVHGNPECSCIFSKVIQNLLSMKLPRTRIITVDHIGFGLSSQATGVLDPADHVANLGALLAFLSPSRITLVVHDWGGPIGLGAMLEQADRLQNLVVLNSGIFPLSATCNYRNYPFSWLPWSCAPALVPNRYWGRFAAGAISCGATGKGQLVRYLLGSLVPFGKHVAPDSPYASQFRSMSNVTSSKQLARLAGSWCEPRPENTPVLNRLYSRLQSEVKGLWGSEANRIQARLLCGEWDALGKRENAVKWLQALPQMEGHMQFFGSGHFLPETHAPKIAQEIYALLSQA